MPRGQRIGDAYVRIHADGRGIENDIERDFDNLDPVMETLGEKHSQTYYKAFEKELERRGTPKSWLKIAQSMNEEFGRFDAGAEWTRQWDDRLDALRDKITTEFGPEVGERFVADIRQGMNRGWIGTNEDFERAISNIRPKIAQIVQQIDADHERTLAKMLRDQEAYLKKEADALSDSLRVEIRERENHNKAVLQGFLDRAAEVAKIEDLRIKDMIKGEKAWADEQERIHKAELDRLKATIIERAEFEKQQDKLVADFQARMEKQKQAAIQATTVRMKEMRDEVDRLVKGNSKWGDSVRDVNSKLRVLREDMRGLKTLTPDLDRDFRRMRASMITLSPTLSRVNRQWSDMADNIGRLTGRGSRNNFINFFGSITRNFTRLVGTVTVGLGRMAFGFVKFAKAIPEMISDPKLLGQMVVNFASGVANLIPSLVAAGVAIGAFALFAGVMSAALSGVLAIVSALAATISFALIGAIGALAGLLLPLAGTIGVVTGAFLALSDAKKEALKNDLQPLADEFKELGQAAGDILFRDVGQWARDLAPVISRLSPIVEGVARSIRDVLGGAIDDVTSNEKNGFDKFITTMRRTLPDAVESLGNSLVDAFGGFAGIFRAIASPGGILERFLGWLEEITSEFNEWANSVRGQRELRDFFEKAGDAAATLGDFIGEVTAALGELFDQSVGTGNNIFEDMANAARDFLGYLQDNPDAVGQWLEDGEKLATAIGDAVTAVIDFVDAMDTPETRELLRDLLGLFEDFVNLLAKIDPKVLLALSGSLLVIFNWLEKIKGLKIDFGKIFDMTTIGQVFQLISRLSRTLGSIRIRIPNPFQAVQRGAEGLRRLISRLPGLINKIPVVGPIFRNVLDRVGAFIRLLNSIPGLIRRIPSPPEIFRAVINAAQRLIQLVGNIIGRLRDILPVPNPFSLVISAASTLMGWLNDIADFFSRTFSLNISWPDPPGYLDELLGGLGGALTSTAGTGALPDVGGGGGRGSGGVASPTRSTVVEAGAITVVTPTKDPKAVAQELLNHVVALGY
jgi:hypothetical protein